MWIQLTATDGRTISLNSKHLVALRDHGDCTMVTHSYGEALVKESQPAILSALRLHEIDRSGGKSERRQTVQ